MLWKDSTEVQDVNKALMIPDHDSTPSALSSHASNPIPPFHFPQVLLTLYHKVPAHDRTGDDQKRTGNIVVCIQALTEQRTYDAFEHGQEGNEQEDESIEDQAKCEDNMGHDAVRLAVPEGGQGGSRGYLMLRMGCKRAVTEGHFWAFGVVPSSHPESATFAFHRSFTATSTLAMVTICTCEELAFVRTQIVYSFASRRKHRIERKMSSDYPSLFRE